jgi:type IV pilus assembly protein PilQ
MKKNKIITICLIIIISLSLIQINIAEAQEDQKQPTVSTVFFENSIRDALNEVSMQTGVNILYDETVVGTVTIDLQEVPLEKALEMMLISGGYTYKKIDDYYIVGSPNSNSPMYDKLSTSETITLDCITANHAVELLPPYYEKYISTTGEDKNSLTITAPENIIKNFKEKLSEIDKAEPQVLIEVTVTEISKEVIKERGMDLFNITTEGASENYSLEYDGIFALSASGPAGQLLSQIKLLEEQNKAEIVANPSIRVSNKETANLFIGEEQVLILEREEGDTQEEVEVGVSIEVTPEIKNKDEVRMNIAPDISHFTEQSDNKLVVRRSEMSSTIRGKSGETITMAGMTLDEVVNYENKVPGLGDIPLIRWLFREETERKGEREMLILITPKIIEQ